MASVALDVAGHRKALRDTVQWLAQRAARSPRQALADFNLFLQHIAYDVPASGLESFFGPEDGRVSGHIPASLELGAVFRAGKLDGIAYLSQGPMAATLSSSVGLLTKGTLDLLSRHGFSQSHGQLFADCLRLALGDLKALDHYSAKALAMLTGVVPHPDQPTFKLYWNTRIDTSRPHRERVLELLARVGLDAATTYDRVYSDNARFAGVGVDLRKLQEPRAKLYVRVDAQKAEEEIARLSAELTVGKTATAEAHGLLEILESHKLSDEVELAIALLPDGTASLKLTVFFVSSELGDQDLRTIEAHAPHIARGFLGQVTDMLMPKKREYLKDEHPLHGIGLELCGDEALKTSVYLQPSPPLKREVAQMVRFGAPERMR